MSSPITTLMYFLRQDLLLSLELRDTASLTSQLALKIPPSPPAECWDDKKITRPPLLFMGVPGTLTLVLNRCAASALSNELPL